MYALGMHCSSFHHLAAFCSLLTRPTFLLHCLHVLMFMLLIVDACSCCLQVMMAVGGCSSPGVPVLSCYLNPDKRFAFVEFRSVEEASNAMAFDGVACQVGCWVAVCIILCVWDCSTAWRSVWHLLGSRSEPAISEGEPATVSVWLGVNTNNIISSRGSSCVLSSHTAFNRVWCYVAPAAVTPFITTG